MTTVARRSGNPVAEMLDWLESASPFSLTSTANYLRVEDYVQEGDYVVRAEMPGVDPEKDIEVSIEGDVLTIRGQRREEERDKNHSEFRYGSFSRSIRLPGSVQAGDVSAKYDAGVLEVRVPVASTSAEPTKIPVQRAKE
ncbi:MAG: Hsp20/alpha crystallin family protein [Nocardioidaceae bacterium]